MLLSSCGTSDKSNDQVTSDSSTSSITHNDTTMPKEPATAAVSATDSVTPNAQEATKQDSVGSKISVHKGKVKVVDTTNKDK